MCGRYVSPETAEIEREWRIGKQSSTLFGRRYNVAPTMMVQVIRSAADGSALELADARWGFIPTWWKQSKPPARCFNAASEHIAVKPMWRDPYRDARCLIPALGWYEWNAQRKQPYYFLLGPDRLAAFAGLLSSWAVPGKEPLLTCAIITRPSAGAAAAVHDRMPAVLRSAAQAAWLDPGLRDADEVGKILQAGALDDARCYPVRTLVNSSKVDGAELIAPLS